MYLLFKNYWLVRVTYLLIRFSKTKFLQWNTKDTPPTLTERYDWEELFNMKMSDRVPPPPSLF